MVNRRSFLRWSLSWPMSAPLLEPLFVVSAREDARGQRDDTLTKSRPTDVESLASALVLKKDALFFVARPDGTVPMAGHHGMGLYYHDCRYLNGFELALSGVAPAPLSASAMLGSFGIITLTNPAITLHDGGTVAKEQLGLTWHRLLDSDRPALLDDLTLQNFTLRRLTLSLQCTFRSSFEDLYDVRGLLNKRYGRLHEPVWEQGTLHFAYDGQDGVMRSLFVHADPPPDARHGTTATFHVDLPPRERRQLRLSLIIEESTTQRSEPAIPRSSSLAKEHVDLERHVKDWMAGVTQVSANGSGLDELLDRAFRGLRMLRSNLGQDAYFAAGVPWFVTLFGRDSLITALQMLAYQPGIAEDTLRLLARYQGVRVDEWRDEQPGKILHELRVGEMANLGVIPHTPFYGTVDATPLFIILIAQHAAWTGSLRLFHELRDAIERALMWMDTYGFRPELGYLAYDSRADNNLINKGWKDSGVAIVNADGTLAEPPIALAEVQGYAYSAKLGIADVFARAGEEARADQLRSEAEQLRERFNRDFWMEDEGCYMLARQKNARPAAVVSSNAGQALWTGIAHDDKARRTIDRLTARDMFSGWGVRTLSTKALAYNPIGYHLGTVWPHDNAIIAAGFRRHGRDREALDIFHGLFDAAFHFPLHQLPEVFCGFSREEYEIPVSYPVACHPQAWASGALPFLLIILLGLEPDGFEHRLRVVRPLLPRGLDRLTVRALHIGTATVDLAFQRGAADVHAEVLKVDGELDVQVEK